MKLCGTIFAISLKKTYFFSLITPGDHCTQGIRTKLYNWHLCKAYPRLGEIQQQVYVILVRNSFRRRLVAIISTWLHVCCSYRYEDSPWGWNDKKKKDEMTDDRAWFVLKNVFDDHQF